MNNTVTEYLREDGTNPYKKWFDELDVQAATKVAAAKVRLELGNTSEDRGQF
jgi:putative component of toxin-antitoxin plasmid stabilization module